MNASPAVSQDTHVRVAPGIYARAFGADLILLDFARGEYFGLDDVGAEVWRAFERGASVDGATRAVTEAFDVPWERALADVRALTSDMCMKSLVVLTENSAAPSPPPSP